MTKPLRDARIPIMFNQFELTEIDDFRFQNRIGTRAGSIRHLVRLGLRATELLTKVEQERLALMEPTDDDYEVLSEAELVRQLDAIAKVH